MLTYDQIHRKVEQAEADKQKWKSYLEECYCYFIPSKNSFQDQPGQAKDQKVFDSTAIDAIADYAARMESQLVPSGREWMQLEAGSDIPKDQKAETDKTLELMTDIVFNHINSSNFSSQINECFLDLGISTGAIIIEEGDGIQSSLRFRSVPLSDLLLQRSNKGIVDTVFRKLTLPLYDFAEMFPYAELTEELKTKLKNSPQTEIEIVEGVIGLEGPSNFEQILIHPEKKDILYQVQIDSSPWVIFRESTTPGETYGRGRAMRCLADTKTLNTVMQYYIETCELLGNPIYTAVDDGIINPSTITVRPKTIIPVGASDSIQALPVSGSPELNIDLMNRLQDSIRRTMLSKPFGQIDETPVRTATEMSIRNADLAQTSGAASGRIQQELLESIIKRSVYILKKVGKIADFRVNGKEVKIKFTSPSAKQQDEQDLATTMRYLEAIQSLPPEVIQQTLKIEEVPRYMADVMGVSNRILRTEQEQMAMKQKMAQQQQQQAMQNQDATQTEMAPPEVL